MSESLTKLVDEFAKLPGIGRKSAERLAYHVLRVHKTEALALADAIRNVKENVRYCRVCYNLAEAEQCAICRDPSRDRELLCVVEQPRDLMALEQAGSYRGLVSCAVGPLRPAGRDRARAIDDRRPGRAGSRRAVSRNHHGHQSDAGRGRHGPVYLESVGRFAGARSPAWPGASPPAAC